MRNFQRLRNQILWLPSGTQRKNKNPRNASHKQCTPEIDFSGIFSIVDKKPEYTMMSGRIVNDENSLVRYSGLHVFDGFKYGCQIEGDGNPSENKGDE